MSVKRISVSNGIGYYNAGPIDGSSSVSVQTVNSVVNDFVTSGKFGGVEGLPGICIVNEGKLTSAIEILQHNNNAVLSVSLATGSVDGNGNLVYDASGMTVDQINTLASGLHTFDAANGSSQLLDSGGTAIHALALTHVDNLSDAISILGHNNSDIASVSLASDSVDGSGNLAYDVSSLGVGDIENLVDSFKTYDVASGSGQLLDSGGTAIHALALTHVDNLSDAISILEYDNSDIASVALASGSVDGNGNLAYDVSGLGVSDINTLADNISSFDENNGSNQLLDSGGTAIHALALTNVDNLGDAISILQHNSSDIASVALASGSVDGNGNLAYDVSGLGVGDINTLADSLSNFDGNFGSNQLLDAGGNVIHALALTSVDNLADAISILQHNNSDIASVALASGSVDGNGNLAYDVSGLGVSDINTLADNISSFDENNGSNQLLDSGGTAIHALALTNVDNLADAISILQHNSSDIASVALASGVADGSGNLAYDVSSLGVSDINTLADNFSNFDTEHGSSQILDASGTAIHALALTNVNSIDDAISILQHNSSDIVSVQLAESASYTAADESGTYSSLIYNSSGVSLHSLDVPICYLPGTLITTTDGDVPVEELSIGDLLPTHSGKVLPVKWVGTQKKDGRLLDQHRSPVCFKAGSLGNGLPKRDLRVSAGHAMYLDGVMVLASLLVNGITITQDKVDGPVHLYQVDLGEHHAILAEGAYAESYAEWRRERFDNVVSFYELYPGHQAKAQEQDQVRYAPHITTEDDHRLPAIIDSLLSFVPSTHITSDPDLHLLVDGQRVNPLELNANGRTTFTFVLPQTAKHVRLVSRKNRPLHIGQSNDLRELGFCVQELSAAYEGGHASVTFSAQHPKLEDNYYLAHHRHNQAERWTKGNAYVPVELMHLALKTQDPQTITTPIRLTIRGYGLGRYLLPKESTAIASVQQPANQPSYAAVGVGA